MKYTIPSFEKGMVSDESGAIKDDLYRAKARALENFYIHRTRGLRRRPPLRFFEKTNLDHASQLNVLDYREINNIDYVLAGESDSWTNEVLLVLNLYAYNLIETAISRSDFVTTVHTRYFDELSGTTDRYLTGVSTDYEVSYRVVKSGSVTHYFARYIVTNNNLAEGLPGHVVADALVYWNNSTVLDSSVVEKVEQSVGHSVDFKFPDKLLSDGAGIEFVLPGSIAKIEDDRITNNLYLSVLPQQKNLRDVKPEVFPGELDTFELKPEHLRIMAFNQASVLSEEEYNNHVGGPSMSTLPGYVHDMSLADAISEFSGERLSGIVRSYTQSIHNSIRTTTAPNPFNLLVENHIRSTLQRTCKAVAARLYDRLKTVITIYDSTRISSGRQKAYLMPDVKIKTNHSDVKSINEHLWTDDTLGIQVFSYQERNSACTYFVDEPATHLVGVNLSDIYTHTYSPDRRGDLALRQRVINTARDDGTFGDLSEDDRSQAPVLDQQDPLTVAAKSSWGYSIAPQTDTVLPAGSGITSFSGLGALILVTSYDVLGRNTTNNEGEPVLGINGYSDRNPHASIVNFPSNVFLSESHFAYVYVDYSHPDIKKWYEDRDLISTVTSTDWGISEYTESGRQLRLFKKGEDAFSYKVPQYRKLTETSVDLYTYSLDSSVDWNAFKADLFRHVYGVLYYRSRGALNSKIAAFSGHSFPSMPVVGPSYTKIHGPTLDFRQHLKPNSPEYKRGTFRLLQNNYTNLQVNNLSTSFEVDEVPEHAYTPSMAEYSTSNMIHYAGLGVLDSTSRLPRRVRTGKNRIHFYSHESFSDGASNPDLLYLIKNTGTPRDDRLRQARNIPLISLDNYPNQASQYLIYSDDILSSSVIRGDIYVATSDDVTQIKSSGLWPNRLPVATRIVERGLTTPLIQESTTIIGAKDDQLIGIYYSEEGGSFFPHNHSRDVDLDILNEVILMLQDHNLILAVAHEAGVFYVLSLGSGGRVNGFSKFSFNKGPISHVRKVDDDRVYVFFQNTRACELSFKINSDTRFLDDVIQNNTLTTAPYTSTAESLPIALVDGMGFESYLYTSIVQASVFLGGSQADFKLAFKSGQKTTEYNVRLTQGGVALDSAQANRPKIIQGLPFNALHNPTIEITTDSEFDLRIGTIELEIKEKRRYG